MPRIGLLSSNRCLPSGGIVGAPIVQAPARIASRWHGKQFGRGLCFTGCAARVREPATTRPAGAGISPRKDVVHDTAAAPRSADQRRVLLNTQDSQLAGTWHGCHGSGEE